MTGDKFIKWGFWCQLILLAIIDWGSISAFINQEVAWYHYIGFALVNIVLLGLTWVLWGWMRDKSGRPLNSHLEDEP